MRRNSEINKVHTARLGDKYAHVKAYLRKRKPDGRRSYKEYIGPVYKLTDKDRSVAFQSECLLPRNDRGRPRVLLLFSNAHPESIKNGMFHTAEGKVAALWNDLCKVGLFSGDRSILENPDRLRGHCLSVAYESSFAFGFACYWIFPTFYPKHLRTLFGKGMEPPNFGHSKRRLDRILEQWRPRAIISFNGKVFGELTGKSTKGYTKRLRRGLFQGDYETSDRDYPIFQTFPSGWRFLHDAPKLRQRSIKGIARAVQSPL